jgi:microcystin-dependent protein
MAITINHPFVSAKGDGSDATLVRPSNWNASHNLNMATSRVIGRLTAGPGLAEELPVTSYMMNLLNTADYATLALALGLPITGDAMLTYTTAARVGWVFANDGTVGDVGSGATTAAANTSALFTHFYNTFSDAICPIFTSAGAGTTRAAQGTASIAFGTNKCRMSVPKNLGRAIIVAGSGAGLSSRALGGTGGAEAHQLVAAEVPDHVHTQQGTFGGAGSGSGSISGSGSGSCSGTTNAADRSLDHLHAIGGMGFMNQNNVHGHGVNGGIYGGVTFSGTQGGGTFTGPAGASAIGINNVDINHTHNNPATTNAADRSLDHLHTFGGSASVTISGSASVTVSVSTTISGNTTGAGLGGGFHNNMQPWTAWNILIRL